MSELPQREKVPANESTVSAARTIELPTDSHVGSETTIPSDRQTEAVTLGNVGARVDDPTRVNDKAEADRTLAYGERDPSTTLALSASSVAAAQKTPTRVRYFGDYELLEEIARGGMGVIYKARQVKLNRVVAIKMILAGELASPHDVQRFLAEAEAAANLNHPNIVPIFEIGEHAGQHYFSMGFIEGASLSSRLHEGPLPPREAAELLRTVASAVHYAHRQGVVHRDLKPANILLDKDKSPKVTDFGLAKKLKSDQGLTVSGQIVGTPSYMPPEQAAGKSKDIGPISDVYSLGAVLYSLLTGRPPFQAAMIAQTLYMVLTQEPVSPRELNHNVDRDLETICLKCLEKDVAARYASAQELADELDRFLRNEPIHARPISPVARMWRWCKRKPLVASLSGALVAVIAIGFAGVTYQWRMAVAARLAESTAKQHAEANFRTALSAVDQMLTRIGDEKLANVPQMEQVRRELLEEALLFHEGFIRERSGDPAVQRETAQAYLRTGKIKRLLGKRDDAERDYELSLALLRPLVRQYPGAPGFAFDLAVACYQSSNLFKDRERRAEALGLLDESVSLLVDLVGRFPTDLEIRFYLARSYNEQAILSTDAEQRTNALRQAIELQQRLCADAPQVAEYRHYLTRFSLNLATLQHATQPKEAETAYRETIAILEKLVADAPNNADYRRDLSHCYDNLGKLLIPQGRLDDAAIAYRETITLHSKLVADYPTVLSYQQELANWYRTLGDVLRKANRGKDATEAFEQAAGFLRRLAAEQPAVVRHRLDLIEALLRLGDHRRASEAVSDLVRQQNTDTRFFEQAARALVRSAAFAQKDASLPPSDRTAIVQRLLDQAVELLARAIEAGTADRSRLAGDLAFRPLQQHPRFKMLTSSTR